MQLELVLTSRQRSQLFGHLDATKAEERFAALLVGSRPTGSSMSLYCHRVITFSDPTLADYSRGVQLTPQGIVSMINAANSEGTGLIEVHSHPGATRGVSFSSTDEVGFVEFVPFALASLKPGRPYGSVVVGGTSLAGCAWFSSFRNRVAISRFPVCDEFRLPAENNCRAQPRMDERRLTRQIAAIGGTGQRLLGGLTVAIVGLGGIGSIVARTLAYEGVQRFVLIDPDLVQYSNLNRLDGATLWDAFFGRKKVAVLWREIRRINPRSQVTVIPHTVHNPRSLAALVGVDLIVGCTDNHASRLYLNEVSAAFLKVYIDVGTGITAENGSVLQAGGRVTVVVPGDGCLLCARAVNTRAAAFELLPEKERHQARGRGYVDGDEVPAPSVMSLNQTLASIGVTELKALVTGIRAPIRQVFYDLLTSQAAPCNFKTEDACLVCHSFLGKGDYQEIAKRYSRAYAEMR
jgi:molybdopterin/thiamine biosynthesis adenylyltransferase